MNTSRVGLLLVSALLGLLLAWHLWWSSASPVANWLSLLLHALPLLPGLVLLLRGAPSGLLVAAFGALLPFSLGVMEAWANPSVRIPALAETLLALGVIGAACWSGLRRRFAGAPKV